MHAYVFEFKILWFLYTFPPTSWFLILFWESKSSRIQFYLKIPFAEAFHVFEPGFFPLISNPFSLLRIHNSRSSQKWTVPEEGSRWGEETRKKALANYANSFTCNDSFAALTPLSTKPVGLLLYYKKECIIQFGFCLKLLRFVSTMGEKNV